jgi:hypothetical protein
LPTTARTRWSNPSTSEYSFSTRQPAFLLPEAPAPGSTPITNESTSLPRSFGLIVLFSTVTCVCGRSEGRSGSARNDGPCAFFASSLSGVGGSVGSASGGGDVLRSAGGPLSANGSAGADPAAAVDGDAFFFRNRDGFRRGGASPGVGAGGMVGAEAGAGNDT